MDFVGHSFDDGTWGLGGGGKESRVGSPELEGIAAYSGGEERGGMRGVDDAGEGTGVGEAAVEEVEFAAERGVLGV